MKKQVLSILLALCLCLTLPTTALADTDTGSTTHADHCICGATHTSVGDHTEENKPFTGDNCYAISTASQLLATGTVGGTYYLTADVTITSSNLWRIGSITGRFGCTADSKVDITLCLNGHTITLDNSSNNDGNGCILIENGSLTITDCGGKGKITGVENGNEKGIVVACWSQGCTFNLYGGTITGITVNGGSESSNYKGGGVYNEGVFNMYGGSITGNKAYNGGGVYNSANYQGGKAGNAVFNLYGGSISGNSNTAPVGGMNVCIGAENKGNTVTMNANGGTVSDTVYNWGTITTADGYDGTTFTGDVSNAANGTIGGGTFNGKVSNDSDGISRGTITGGTFNGTVNNSGTITGGTLYGTVLGNGTIADAAKLTVTFDSNGGSTVDEQKVLKGQTVTTPTAPTRDGWSFVGWYTDSGCTSKYNFSSTVTSALTLYAKWTCAGHIGGAATCKDKAVCSVCGEPYGAVDTTKHTGEKKWTTKNETQHKQTWSCCGAVEVTLENHEWKDGVCKDCGYVEPTPAPDTTPQPHYVKRAAVTGTVIGAEDYTSGNTGLTFKSSASFASFQGVQVDGKTIDSRHYIAEAGSIEVYLKATYLQTLAAGKHTVTILSTEGNVTMDFTVGGVTGPKTFDAGAGIYAVTALLSYTGSALVIRGRKKS